MTLPQIAHLGWKTRKSLMMQDNLKMLESEAFQLPKVGADRSRSGSRAHTPGGLRGGGGGGKTGRALSILHSPSLATSNFQNYKIARFWGNALCGFATRNAGVSPGGDRGFR